MTRELLLKHGLQLFEAQGYVPTTVDDIAAAAGTTRTTFYMHFPSKSHLMQALIVEVNEFLISTDDPPLSGVVASGAREEIAAWLGRKIDQWSEIRPYVLAAHEAAGTDPDTQKAVDAWFEGAIGDIERGLEKANRFDPPTRRIRAALAFGQLEFLSVRWMRHGWDVDRDTAHGLLVDAWVALLVD
jgi:AcrR family transcriptional regulator